jgi:L-2-hydroxyglutarate oxidase
MQPFDCVVVGGGIVGLSVAWGILKKNPGARVAVLEKEESLAYHIRNGFNPTITTSNINVSTLGRRVQNASSIFV